MLLLVVGDAHIPDRATAIPEPIRKLLVPGKISQVVSVGHMSDAATRETLRRITPETPVRAVAGEFDVPSNDLPTFVEFRAGRFKIGVISGFMVTPADDQEALATIARSKDVDILLWGGSHRQEIQEWASYYFVNPGSVTGATNPETWAEEGIESASPSFCLLDVSDDAFTVYMYHLEGKDLKVEKAKLPLRTH